MTSRSKKSASAALLLVAACGAREPTVSRQLDEPRPAPEQAARTSLGRDSATRTVTTHVETHPAQGPQRDISNAEARLVVTDRGAAASMFTRELTPGHAYTLWFVAINRPENCASSPCKGSDVIGNSSAVEADVRWADGGIATADGTLELNTWVPAGNWDSGWFEAGYRNLESGEIHLVLNDHGPVIPGRESEMLSSYRGGCTDESLPPPFPATAKSDGAAGPNSCALVQDAIFRPAPKVASSVTRSAACPL